jgi:hypothetical protein
VIQSDGPQLVFEDRSLTLAEGNQLSDPVAVGPRRQGLVARLEAGAHVEGHRREVEGRTDERVIEVEGTEAHPSTVTYRMAGHLQ